MGRSCSRWIYSYMRVIMKFNAGFARVFLSTINVWIVTMCSWIESNVGAEISHCS